MISKPPISQYLFVSPAEANIEQQTEGQLIHEITKDGKYNILEIVNYERAYSPIIYNMHSVNVDDEDKVEFP